VPVQRFARVLSFFSSAAVAVAAAAAVAVAPAAAVAVAAAAAIAVAAAAAVALAPAAALALASAPAVAVTASAAWGDDLPLPIQPAGVLLWYYDPTKLMLQRRVLGYYV